MQFKDVIGLSEIKQNLITSVKENRIAHSQLFMGGEGCGNLALARAYVQYIFCKSKTENDSCGSCSTCAKIAKLIHPDLHFSFHVIGFIQSHPSTSCCTPILFREDSVRYMNLIKW